MIRSSYSLESPLDRTATYPKTETLSRANLTLHIPLELDDGDLDGNKVERLSWLCLHEEVWRIAPPYTIMGETLLRHIFTFMIFIWTASFKHMISSRWLILNLHFISSFFIMLMSWRYALELTPSLSSRHTCHRLKSYMTNLWITPWLTPWSSLNLLHFLLLSTLKPTYGSSIGYGQILQV